MKDLSKATKRALQSWSKLIAMHVRNEMEDFHCEHLNDDQMKELNPIIRKAIFEVLRQVYFLKKGNKKQRLMGAAYIHHLFLSIPTYWEEPDLTAEERSEENEFVSQMKDTPMMHSESSMKKLFEFFRNQIGVFDSAIPEPGESMAPSD
jgi:hypothetical protein